MAFGQFESFFSGFNNLVIKIIRS